MLIREFRKPIGIEFFKKRPFVHKQDNIAHYLILSKTPAINLAAIRLEDTNQDIYQ